MKLNLGTLDKILRILVAVAIGVLYFAKVISGTLGIVLVILAIIFLITAILGFCPIYAVLGLSSRKKE
jgi:hypothetical protein